MRSKKRVIAVALAEEFLSHSEGMALGNGRGVSRPNRTSLYVFSGVNVCVGNNRELQKKKIAVVS